MRNERERGPQRQNTAPADPVFGCWIGHAVSRGLSPISQVLYVLNLLDRNGRRAGGISLEDTYSARLNRFT
jgi:hypothetical protein